LKHHHIARLLMPFVFGLVLPATLTPAQTRETTVRGSVSDGSRQSISGARAYRIPAADVENLATSPIDRKRNSANDEPDKKGTSEIKPRISPRDAPAFHLILLLAALSSHARAR
jgi:hypothetical protein